jgi:isopenicillin N synthase-like dioxygenase
VTRTTGSIPIVDVEPLTSGEACPQTLSALRQANQEAGFVYVRNHGIASSVIDAARQSAVAFFQLSQAEKSAVTVSRQHRGWLAQGEARMSDNESVDLKESFIWGAPNEPNAPATNHSLQGPNQWPDHNCNDFRTHASAWFEAAQHLAESLLRGFARSLDLSDNFFLSCSDRPLSRASYVFYPHQSTLSNNQFGVAPHTDFGMLTILCQDEVGGLQIENADGVWIDAPPLTDTLVVNIGDLLHRWTNGLFRSARHRVVCPQDSDRLSLVLAYDPNPETLIDAADLAFSGSIQEQPITCGDYLDWRFSKAFAYRDTSA